MGFKSIMRTNGFIEGKSQGRCTSFTFIWSIKFVSGEHSREDLPGRGVQAREDLRQADRQALQAQLTGRRVHCTYY